MVLVTRQFILLLQAALLVGVSTRVEDSSPLLEQHIYEKVQVNHHPREHWPSSTDKDHHLNNSNITNNTSTTQEKCSDPRHPQPLYNSSCEYVHAECSHKVHLVDYLAFIFCDLKHVKPLGYILLALWDIYLISLLATTVDYFFVPPLNFLAEKMKLSPGVAGITLLALGNAAPDVFVVFSGITQDDVGLVLGSLAGGAMFITTIVLATVIIVAKSKEYKLDKFDFMRDILAFMVIFGVIIAVAFDGKVHLVEACSFPFLYVLYLIVVIGIGCVRDFWCQRPQRVQTAEEETIHWDEEADGQHTISLDSSLPLKRISNVLKDGETMPLLPPEGTDKKLNLPGLTWPTGAHVLVKFIWLVQWPFTLVRWMTIPPFYHDGCWSRWHYGFAVCSPVPMGILLLIAAQGWKGFSLYAGIIPLPALLFVIGILLSVAIFFALSSKKPPHWIMQSILVPSAFIMAIVWLNIEATEVVSVLKALGLMLNIDTAILGLTVLAIGNSVADWVADTVVAKHGKPEMAFASCFGSPLMSNVLGLSLALIIKISIYNHGAPYTFQIHTPDYSQVKFAWIFLGISLISSVLFFPIFRFSPPRLYGAILIFIYAVFVVIAVLAEVNLIPMNL